MDIYKRLILYKAEKNLNYSDLGLHIGKSSDAFRMAMSRKSFSALEIERLEEVLDVHSIKMNIEDIIRTIKSNGITGYEIAQNTSLTEVGINKIISGKTKNPHKRTIEELSNYLTNKVEYFDIKAIRKLRGLSQTELATQLGVSRQTIVNWENGGVIPKSKIALLKTYGLAKINKAELNSAPFIEIESVKFTLDHAARLIAENEELALNHYVIKLIFDKHIAKQLAIFFADTDKLNDWLGE